MTKPHRDPTGLTANQAEREAHKRFGGHPTLGVVYKGHEIHATVAPCDGQRVLGGRKGTRGCLQGPQHDQPCPGGPLVYTISRIEPTMGMRCIEARAHSWAEAIAMIDDRRAADRALFSRPKTVTRKGQKR